MSNITKKYMEWGRIYSVKDSNFQGTHCKIGSICSHHDAVMEPVCLVCSSKTKISSQWIYSIAIIARNLLMLQRSMGNRSMMLPHWELKTLFNVPLFMWMGSRPRRAFPFPRRPVSSPSDFIVKLQPSCIMDFVWRLMTGRSYRCPFWD